MKKRLAIVLIAGMLLFVLLACSIGPLTIDLGLGGDEDTSSNGASAGGGIEAGVNSPAPGAVIPAGPSEIAYYATSVDGVATIELSVDGEVLSTVSNPDTSQQVVALKYTWEPTVSGSHTIRVRAMDAKGNWSNYAAVSVTVESSQTGQQDSQPVEPVQPAEQKPTDTPSATATPEDMTVYNVKHNQDIFYWGGGSCGSKEITIEADITHPDDAYAGMIFFRFWDKEGAGLSSWSAAYPMARDSDEHFRITISSENIANYNKFEFAVMYYQIKIQSKPPNAVVLAGTDVIKQVELHRCP